MLLLVYCLCCVDVVLFALFMFLCRCYVYVSWGVAFVVSCCVWMFVCSFMDVALYVFVSELIVLMLLCWCCRFDRVFVFVWCVLVMVLVVFVCLVLGCCFAMCLYGCVRLRCLL